jgi:F-type H+-transporting ATPase subunit epsilon
MAEIFQFRLVTPTGVVFDGAVEEVTATNLRGEFGVLADHINFISSLVPCLLQVNTADGAKETWVLSGGLAEVKDGAMTVLADGAVAAAAIDLAAAEREEREADEKLATLSFYDADYAGAHDLLLLARALTRAASPDSSNQ